MKLFKTFIILIIISGFFAFQSDEESFHELKNADAFIEKIKAYSATTNTIKSDFIQEKHLTILEEVLVSNGHFIFEKEGNVLWEYKKPIDYAIIVCDGKFIIRDGNKVSSFDIESNRMFREINKMIVTSVSGDFLNNPDFDNAYFENESYYLVKLTPLNNEVKNTLSGIYIYFDKNDISVSQVKFIEPGDDFTHIRFFNKIFNEPVSNQVFNLEKNH